MIETNQLGYYFYLKRKLNYFVETQQTDKRLLFEKKKTKITIFCCLFALIC